MAESLTGDEMFMKVLHEELEAQSVETTAISIQIKYTTALEQLKKDFEADMRSLQSRMITRKSECSMCDYSCDDTPALVLHYNTAHAAFESFKCEICGRAFSSARGLGIHASFHKPKGAKCTICQKSYSARTINLHYKHFHQLRVYSSVSSDQNT